VAAHAWCPVAIVRRPPTRPADSPIVAGFDGSAPAAAALRLAFTEAHLRGMPLTIVQADPDLPGKGTSADDLDLHHEIARLSAEFPTVRPRTELVAQDPAKALMHAAGHARILVVGSRGAGGVRGLVLGSVSQRLVRHSPCTIIVAHARP